MSGKNNRAVPRAHLATGVLRLLDGGFVFPADSPGATGWMEGEDREDVTLTFGLWSGMLAPLKDSCLTR